MEMKEMTKQTAEMWAREIAHCMSELLHAIEQGYNEVLPYDPPQTRVEYLKGRTHKCVENAVEWQAKQVEVSV